LTVADEFTREGLSVAVQTRMPSGKVLEELGRLFLKHGTPKYLRSDNGPEFIAKLVKQWLKKLGVAGIHIDPGSPWQNPYIESFNGRLRDECLNMELFMNLNEARIVTEKWRNYYNEERPHSSLGYQTPLEFLAGWKENDPEMRKSQFLAA